jgi:2-keto-3-deoxygluconate permease
MKIPQTVNKVPGGLMVAPMLIGILVNTFTPEAEPDFLPSPEEKLR